jgi:hypothetical protein
VLDIGPQTIYFASDEQIREFVANQGGSAAPRGGLEREVARLIHFSTPRAGASAPRCCGNHQPHQY